MENIPDDAEETNALNKYILSQLSQQNMSGLILTGGFALPQLKLGNDKPNAIANQVPATKFVLPPFKTKSDTSKITQSSQQQDDTEEKSLIDLTKALSINVPTTAVNTSRSTIKQSTYEEKFDIPFIECDRRVPRVDAKSINEYCQVDVSAHQWRHCLVPPSAIGRILVASAVKPIQLQHPLKTTASIINPKHYIEPFNFNTESPDDIVARARKKYMHH